MPRARELSAGLDHAELCAELPERHRCPGVVPDHGAELCKLDLSGGELCAHLVELLATVPGLDRVHRADPLCTKTP